MTRNALEDATTAREAFQAGLDKAGVVKTARLNYFGEKSIRIVFFVEAPKHEGLIEIPLMFQAKLDWKMQVKTQGARYGARISKGIFTGE